MHVRIGECLTQRFAHDHATHRNRYIAILLLKGLQHLSAALRCPRTAWRAGGMHCPRA